LNKIKVFFTLNFLINFFTVQFTFAQIKNFGKDSSSAGPILAFENCPSIFRVYLDKDSLSD